MTKKTIKDFPFMKEQQQSQPATVVQQPQKVPTEILQSQGQKYKVLTLCDHPLATSGVGVQARFLIDGLVKTGKYSFRCLGGAIKHPDYSTVMVNPDFIIKPVDGFGNKEMLRLLLATEKPDALFLFTDPRQFIWVWEMEEEIHQVCPIVYWHVWDNDPYPAFNSVLYASNDLINCLAYKTYELVKPQFPEMTHYIPHSFPKNVYFPLPEEQVKAFRSQHFGNKSDWFMALWVNRNAGRKVPSDVLESWKQFLDILEEKEGHRKGLLLMHTDPNDQEGPNLFAVSEMLGLTDNVWFSPNRVGFDEMNMIHNASDVCVNIAKNEGFGLSTLISMQVGKPIVALKTGGVTRQVVDYRDGSEHGVAIEPCKRMLVGSQLVPYIYEDYASQKDVAEGFYKIYKMTAAEKQALSQKMRDYVDHEFAYSKMVEKWDETLFDCITKFKTTKRKRWSFSSIDPVKVANNTLQPTNNVAKPPMPVAQMMGQKTLPAKTPIDIQALIKAKTEAMRTK